jgi:uncharacterized protein (TIGR03435 family)
MKNNWKMVRTAIGLMLIWPGMAAQQVEFEAASVKAATGAENGITVHFIGGGPGTRAPGLFRCTNCTARELIQRAYDVEQHQVLGGQALNEAVQITAKVAAGATSEQFRGMLRSLLAERFKLALHRETRDMQGYMLLVSNGGPQMQHAGPAGEEERPKTRVLKDGFVTMDARSGIQTFRNGDKMSTLAGSASMEQLALELTRGLQRPVVDGTDLRGLFQFEIYWMRDALADGPTLAEGLRKLGLKLERRAMPVQVLVVDHLEKVPTAN